MKHETLYHGSPLVLETLRKGSTVTPFRGLACAFAHKPTIVSIDDLDHIAHNGVQPGYLYVIDEPLGADDVRQHPTSSAPGGYELLTNRDLRLRLVVRLSPPAANEP